VTENNNLYTKGTFMTNKVIYVKAKFKPIGKWETVHVPTGEKKKGLLGEREVMKEEKRWVQTGVSKSEIDGETLARDVELAVQQLNSEGYEVQEVLPVTSGDYWWNREVHLSYGYG
jgi:hypothetical protein